MEDSPNFRSTDAAEAVKHARSLQSDESKTRTDWLSKLKRVYIDNDNDDALKSAVEQLMGASTAEHYGERVDGRSLMVIGETGVGKTEALKRLFREREDLRPYDTDVGSMLPLVSFEAPSPCTLGQFGREFLNALQVPVTRQLHRHLVWEKVRRQLRNRRTLLVHVGEMQHVFESVPPEEIVTLTNTLKNTMQQEDWPVRFIFSGLPSLLDYKGEDAQVWWRCRVARFQNLTFPDDVEFARYIVREIAHKKGGLDLSALQADEFYARFIHAVRGALGRMAELTVDIAVDVLCSKTEEDGTKKLTVADFAETYRSLAGCDDSENVFLADRWEYIDPFRKRSDQQREEIEKFRKNKKGRKS